VKFYETTVVLDPKIGDEEIEKNIQQAEKLITGSNGEMVEIERKGVRKLAYSIKKQKNAYYVIFRHNSEPDSLKAIQNQFKLNEAILRVLVIKQADEKARVRPQREQVEEPGLPEPAGAAETSEETETSEGSDTPETPETSDI
jgi:small subunit ribosomal protein S6